MLSSFSHFGDYAMTEKPFDLINLMHSVNCHKRTEDLQVLRGEEGLFLSAGS